MMLSGSVEGTSISRSQYTCVLVLKNREITNKDSHMRQQSHICICQMLFKSYLWVVQDAQFVSIWQDQLQHRNDF